jgi:HD superfamily phosphohydrolase
MSDIVKVLKQHKVLAIILSVAILVIVVLGIMYYNNKKQMEEMVTELNAEKMELTKEYEELALDFSFQTDIDSINNLLQHERERIEQLIEEIKTIKATNASKIREYKKELATLRKVLKNYIIQIDSLNQRNKQLTEENKEYQQKYTHIRSSMKELEKQKETLEEKVDIASQLELKNIVATGLTGKNKTTKKTNKVAKIRVCFTIKKNITAPVGEKTVYMRIQRPDQSLLMQSLNDKFKFEGSEINFSSKRDIEYEGKDLDVCIYYKVDEGELMKGKYITDIFIDGKNVGTVEFELK